MIIANHYKPTNRQTEREGERENIFKYKQTLTQTDNVSNKYLIFTLAWLNSNFYYGYLTGGSLQTALAESSSTPV